MDEVRYTELHGVTAQKTVLYETMNDGGLRAAFINSRDSLRAIKNHTVKTYGRVEI
jgi:hypothetical protein